MAWKYPVKSSKVQRHFDAVLAPQMEAADADFIRAVWDSEGASGAGLDLDSVLTACTAVVDRLEVLAGHAAPAGWSPPPVPPSIGWDALRSDDRQLLIRVRERAQALCPHARIVLFGSRANGTGQPDSDYDLLVILPDVTDQSIRSEIMSDLHSMAQQLGVEFDREHVSLSTWQNPEPVHRDLVEQAKTYGIEVPDSDGDT
jgi:predicted nucleotidyltransferase